MALWSGRAEANAIAAASVQGKTLPGHLLLPRHCIVRPQTNAQEYLSLEQKRNIHLSSSWAKQHRDLKWIPAPASRAPVALLGQLMFHLQATWIHPELNRPEYRHRQVGPQPDIGQGASFHHEHPWIL